jgi:hypothetical protein
VYVIQNSAFCFSLEIAFKFQSVYSSLNATVTQSKNSPFGVTITNELKNIKTIQRCHLARYISANKRRYCHMCLFILGFNQSINPKWRLFSCSTLLSVKNTHTHTHTYIYIYKSSENINDALRIYRVRTFETSALDIRKCHYVILHTETAAKSEYISLKLVNKKEQT